MFHLYSPLETKQVLLAKYESREPREFIQVDGWHSGKSHRHWTGYNWISTDDDGHSKVRSHTVELMHGAHVRVLIQPDTSATETAALLRKIADWIEREPRMLVNRWELERAMYEEKMEIYHLMHHQDEG